MLLAEVGIPVGRAVDHSIGLRLVQQSMERICIAQINRDKRLRPIGVPDPRYRAQVLNANHQTAPEQSTGTGDQDVLSVVHSKGPHSMSEIEKSESVPEAYQ